MLKNVFCRIFQAGFALGALLLPWRKPERVTGPGSLGRLPELLAEAGCKKPMIVASRRQCAAPEFMAMTEKLTAWSVFSSVTANPKTETVEQLVEQFLAEGCDSMVAIGGGSPMDAAKAAAARLARPDRTLEQMKGLLRVRRRIVPFAAVPTTAGTGSETTIAAVVTDEQHHKYAVGDLCLIPRWAVLDPVLTASLPASVTAETGMDALTHAVEAYIGNSTSRETRALALETVKLVFENIETAYQDGTNRPARANMLYAAHKAGIAFSKSYVGYIHAVAHSLGGQYNIPHGLANSVLMPIVLEAYGEAAHKKLHELGIAAGVTDSGDSHQEGAEKFIQAIRGLNRRLNIPTALPGIRQEDIPQMARHAAKEANPLYPVPVLMDAGELEQFYYKVADWSQSYGSGSAFAKSA